MRRWARAGLAALGLTAATSVVAMASRAPLSRSMPVDASAAGTPVAALSALLVGAGIVALGALVAVFWPSRWREDEGSEMVPEPLGCTGSGS